MKHMHARTVNILSLEYIKVNIYYNIQLHQ